MNQSDADKKFAHWFLDETQIYQLYDDEAISEERKNLIFAFWRYKTHRGHLTVTWYFWCFTFSFAILDNYSRGTNKQLMRDQICIAILASTPWCSKRVHKFIDQGKFGIAQSWIMKSIWSHQNLEGYWNFSNHLKNDRLQKDAESFWRKAYWIWLTY